ncbi:MAG: hypothetical protein KGH49_03950 [Candidatus Micrarchaeota archaeon]|nr:hypothetical protein [Candidatus Micrarchaeota archaeon]
MRLIDLNIWGGKLSNDLEEFISRNRQTTDIFCFQEVLDEAAGALSEGFVSPGAVPDIYLKLCHMLPDFTSLLSDTYTSHNLRLAIFFKRGLKLAGSGEIGLCAKRPVEFRGRTSLISSILQWAEFDLSGRRLTIANVHGLFTPDKLDNPDRIEQSEKIVRFLNRREGAKILCGDLNVDIATKSIGILDGSLQNLIREYNVATTRNWHTPAEVPKFADYVFVSKDVNVEKFEAMQDDVSDHLPLSIRFS